MVIYFGLTNSPAIFQMMMNNLFRDLINQGDMATFIDDILVATDTEEGHDKLVEEVLKRLEENDLFVKPEKYKWKVREVEFLGVVISPKGVEMQKEKVEGVLRKSLLPIRTSSFPNLSIVSWSKSQGTIKKMF